MKKAAFQSQKVEAKGTLLESALCLSNSIVDALNLDSAQMEMRFVCHSAAQILETIRKIVIRRIAEEFHSSVDFRAIADVYESLLNLRLAGSAGSFKLVQSHNEKRKRGVFYTPFALTRELTVLALCPLVSASGQVLQTAGQSAIPTNPVNLLAVERLLSLKIVDPAMGAGSFLLAALDILAECVFNKVTVGNADDDWTALNKSVKRSTDFRGGVQALKLLNSDKLRLMILRTVAVQCLYGVDLDAAAVELAKIGLAIHCRLPVGEESLKFANLRHGNALLGAWNNPSDIAFPFADDLAVTGLSEKERRDLFCLQFFTAMVSAHAQSPSNEPQLARMLAIAESMSFFHWHLEFADVFSGENPGFDLVLTNPPWEIEKANSREFFSRYDPEYMSLSKQSAISQQKQLLAQDSTIEEEWHHYLAHHEGVSAFLKGSAALSQGGDFTSRTPFCHQGGGDSNSYKLFLELGYSLLKTGGVMAQIVPSGIYSDKGTTELRRLFIDRCRWLFLRGYHNREGLFSIHRSFKFCSIGVMKGGHTEQVSCSFSRVSPEETSRCDVPYKIETLKQLSPEYLAFTEISTAEDLQLIEKLASTSAPLGARHKTGFANEVEGDFAVSFRREFDMTNDSKLFIERTRAQEDGYALDNFGHWLKGSWRSIDAFNSQHLGQFAVSFDGKAGLAIDDLERVLLPVYEGRMIGQYDWAKKAWLQGKGRRADWVELPFGGKKILPQYLMELDDYLAMQPQRGAKIAYLAVGAATNSRSCIASLIGDWPCGNSVPVLSAAVNSPGHDEKSYLVALLACLNSFVFDYALRMRLSANNLNWFILKECLVPDLANLAKNPELVLAVSQLSAHEALQPEGFDDGAESSGGYECPGETKLDAALMRLKLRAFVEATIAAAYFIDDRDCHVILKGCAMEECGFSPQKASSIDKGFHRIDQHLPPALRGPSLFFRCFQLLRQYGSKQLYERLKDDDVLFSRRSFEPHASVLISQPNREVIPYMMPWAGGSALGPLPDSVLHSQRREWQVSRMVFQSIRTAGLKTGLPLRAREAGVLSTGSSPRRMA